MDKKQAPAPSKADKSKNPPPSSPPKGPEEEDLKKSLSAKEPAESKSPSKSASSAPADQKMDKEPAKSAPPAESKSPSKSASSAPADQKMDKEPAKSAPAKSPPTEPEKTKTREKTKLSGLYAFKLKMSSLYDEKGRWTPVTFLRFEPWVVSQIKTQKKEGYNSVQMACLPQKNNRSSKALKKHLTPAGFEEGARYVREIREAQVDHVKTGQELSIHSLQKGDKVTVQAISKGHGFAGVVKRWGFRGGPASHGSTIHRSSGSIGNRTEPARVMPGKKMAGHYGAEKVSVKNVPVVDVVEKENLIVLKGPVPGARNGLVYLGLEKRAEK